jgi:hypothetical protein
MNIYSLKMNHLISQERREIELRNLANMLLEARAFKSNEIRSHNCSQKYTMACSFLMKFGKNLKNELDLTRCW